MKSTHQILLCLSLPNHWVVREIATGMHYIIQATANGWNNPRRREFKGHVKALKPVSGYNFASLGVPLVRPWPEVCRDAAGYN